MEFFKKVTVAQLQFGLFALLAILILWGVLKLAFGIGFGPLVDQVVPNGVMIGAVGIFVWNRWLLNEKRKDREAAEAEAAKESLEASQGPGTTDPSGPGDGSTGR